MFTYLVQSEAFDIADEFAKIMQCNSSSGAIASFIGVVRDFSSHPDQQLELEHYPGMTEKSIQDIGERARKQWTLHALTIIHRFGILHCQEPIVLVIASSSHRHEALEAVNFIMDLLKTEAIFWKKEITNGQVEWIEPSHIDHQKAKSWT